MQELSTLQVRSDLIYPARKRKALPDKCEDNIEGIQRGQKRPRVCAASSALDNSSIENLSGGLNADNTVPRPECVSTDGEPPREHRPPRKSSFKALSVEVIEVILKFVLTEPTEEDSDIGIIVKPFRRRVVSSAIGQADSKPLVNPYLTCAPFLPPDPDLTEQDNNRRAVLNNYITLRFTSRLISMVATHVFFNPRKITVLMTPMEDVRLLRSSTDTARRMLGIMPLLHEIRHVSISLGRCSKGAMENYVAAIHQLVAGLNTGPLLKSLHVMEPLVMPDVPDYDAQLLTPLGGIKVLQIRGFKDISITRGEERVFACTEDCLMELEKELRG